MRRSGKRPGIRSPRSGFRKAKRALRRLAYLNRKEHGHREMKRRRNARAKLRRIPRVLDSIKRINEVMGQPSEAFANVGVTATETALAIKAFGEARGKDPDAVLE